MKIGQEVADYIIESILNIQVTPLLMSYLVLEFYRNYKN